MAQTFGQFLHECENYQYSQEYFDILKESMEIDLMERYINTQEFLIESGIDTSVFTEGYFMEADDKSVEDVKNQSNEKKARLFDRIMSKLRSLATKFLSFIRSLYNKITSTSELFSILYAILDSTTNNNSDNDDLINLMNMFISSVDQVENSDMLKYFKVYEKAYERKVSSIASKIYNKYANNTNINISINSITIMVYIYSCLGKRTSPILDISALPENNGVKVANLMTLKSVYKNILNMYKSNKIDDRKIESNILILQKESKDAESKGYMLAHFKDINKYIDEFNNILKAIEDINNTGNVSIEASSMHKLLGILSNVYANLIKLYTEYNQIRSCIQNICAKNKITIDSLKKMASANRYKNNPSNSDDSYDSYYDDVEVEIIDDDDDVKDNKS